MPRGKDTRDHSGRSGSRERFTKPMLDLDSAEQIMGDIFQGWVDDNERELEGKGRERKRAKWERDQVDAADRYYSKIYDF